MHITEDIDEKHVYKCQLLKLQGNVNNDIAIVAQVAEIYGEVKGSIHFMGQQLSIKSPAHVHGNLELRWSQQVVVEGRLDGEVRGTYQTMTDAMGNMTFPGKSTGAPAEEAVTEDASTHTESQEPSASQPEQKK